MTTAQVVKLSVTVNNSVVDSDWQFVTTVLFRSTFTQRSYSPCLWHDSWVHTLHNFRKKMLFTGLALLTYTLPQRFHIWQVDSTYCSYVYVSHSYTSGNNLCDSNGRTTFNALTEISKDIINISLKFKQIIILLQFSNNLLYSQTRQMMRSAQS